MSSSDEDVLRFLASSFPSVWALELLLVLKKKRRAWAREERVATLRASELVVSKALIAFALAFALLGIGQAVLALANIPTEERGALFLIRLSAFALILFAILPKNRAAS